MTPFNIDLFKAGRKALTRDGREATFIAYSEVLEFPVIGKISGYKRAFSWLECGSYLFSSNGPDATDLVSMAPVKREGWANVWFRSPCSLFVSGSVFASEIEARADAAASDWQRIATVRIEWEEA